MATERLLEFWNQANLLAQILQLETQRELMKVELTKIYDHNDPEKITIGAAIMLRFSPDYDRIEESELETIKRAIEKLGLRKEGIYIDGDDKEVYILIEVAPTEPITWSETRT